MELIALKTQQVNRNGTTIFNKISPIILKGLNTVKKALTHMGSKEFILAILPVPKNPKKMNTIKRKALRNMSEVILFLLWYASKLT